MYLTKVQISLDDALRARLTDAYTWHQQLWTTFPGRDGEPRDFLTRVDQRERSLQALVLSPAPPQPVRWGSWETRAVAETFLAHERYVFALRANPTVKRVVRDEGGARRKNGRRTRICGHQDLVYWLERKASEAGFTVEPGVSIGAPVDQISWRCRSKVVHARVEFEGILRVTDRDRFRRAYCSGIGPAKAFGFGLLLLKPLVN